LRSDLLVAAILAALLLLTPDASAEPETGRVTGTVVEARTGVALAAVLVKVQSTGQQAFSDADGRFEIVDVPSGPQIVLVSVVGFGLVRREVAVATGEAVDIRIAVAEGASTYVEDVAVAGTAFREAEPGVASQFVLGSRDLLALRGLVADDPFRAVQVLPGVATGDDFRAEFAVRGLGPSNIGIAVDGVDSPLLFHTVRGVQDTGSIGLINSDIIESATLFAGAHPQRLGAHLGSRLDFTTRDGSRERLTVRGLVSASAASTVWEGPLGSSKRASWLVAVRKSYIDWLLRQIDSTTDTTFGFTDAQGKVSVDLSPRQTLRVSMIAGRSVLREEDADPGPNTLDRAQVNTLIGNVQWRFTPSTRLTISQQAYVLHADYANRVVDGRTREEGGDLDLTWRGGAEWNPRPGHLIEFGANAHTLDAERIDRRFTAQSASTLLDVTGDARSAAGWGQYRWTPTARFSVTPGVRVEHWRAPRNSQDTGDASPGSGDTRASPWLLTELEVRPGMRARVGAGLQHQAPTIDQSIYALPGHELLPQSARTLEAGLEQRFGATWRVAGTVYHRKDRDGLRFRNAEVRIVDNQVVLPTTGPYLVNVLTGDTRGVELVLERRSVNGLNGWLSYAWNKSTLSDGAESFPSDYDQRHTVNAYVVYRWSGRTSLSARLRYGSNFPIAGYIQEVPDGYALSEQRNGARLPAYSRLDLRADRTFTYRKSRLTLFLEVVNAMNQDNFRANTPFFNITTRRVFEPTETLFPLLPVAGVLIEF
jgi:hypothetical protein